MSAGDLIEVEELVKVYPDGTIAVDGVSFCVGEGEMFGFLGPNGAGKTTTVRILVTLLPRTSGRVLVSSLDVASNADRVRRLIGHAGQSIALDRHLTARENLVMQARLHGMRPRAARLRTDELLERFDLVGVADRKATALSGGLQRRLELAQALAHRPPLVFLDEPTTGLDPRSRTALWEQLEDINRGGSTVFLTTQYLEEADRLCHRVGIIDRGRMVVTGSPSELKREIGQDLVTVVLDNHGPAAVERAAAALRTVPGGGEPAGGEGSVVLPLGDAGRRLPDVVRALDRWGVGVAAISVAAPTLDDVFLRATGVPAPTPPEAALAAGTGER